MPPLTGQAAVDALKTYLETADKGRWPKEADKPVLTALNTWQALYDGDKERLKTAADWRDQRRHYRVDPLPERIADAWAHYLFGEDPRITPANAADEANLERTVGSDFPSELERAASLCVSEGEIWARIYVDTYIAERPLLDWVSRANLIPLWAGNRVSAVALVTRLDDPGGDRGKVWRSFEIHAAGTMSNVLYRGKESEVGQEQSLEAHPATAELEPVWNHGLPFMLVTRIPNRLRRNPRCGVSDYRGILDTLLDINESVAIGASNMRLSARKRAVISASYARATSPRDDLTLTPEENGQGNSPPRPVFDVSEEVFLEDPLDTEMGKEGSSPFRILDYGFDAEPLIAWRRELVETALSRVGLTGQYVGVGEAAGVGYAISGTALRLRLIPTDKTGRGKGRYWDDGLPRILRAMGAVDNLPVNSGGFGRPWTDLTELPTVKRAPGLPEDELEEAQRHAALIGAGAESIETAVRRLNPEWDDALVAAEVDRIRADKAATMPSFGP